MDALVARIAAWAEASPDVRGIIVVGSRVRTDHPADEWSDLDLILAVTDTGPYLADGEWLEAIAPVWMSFIEENGIGGWERRVLFEGGLDVDFNFDTLAGIQRLTDDLTQISGVLRRGTRVLLDRDGLFDTWRPLPGLPRYVPPTEAEFTNALHNFWYHAVWSAKKLLRGERFIAKQCCDSHMKRLLLQMLEWHARATHGPEYDTWHEGRFLEEWADPRALAALCDAYASYDAESIRRSLGKSMELYRWLAQETAARLGYAYTEVADAQATAWVEREQQRN
jgi:aminoglycoside 6-adenylyltransferase